MRVYHANQNQNSDTVSFSLPTDITVTGQCRGNAPAAQVEEGIVITVNINTASAEELATLLKGIGLKKAQAIVDYREANGPFTHIDDLTNVKGIGEATVRNNAARILL